MPTIDVIDAPAPSPAHDQAAAYAALIEDAITARQAMDTGRWLLGEYVRMLIDVSVYGEHTIEEFADAVKIDPKRAYEYAAMATYYDLETRESMAHLDLCYSQYREAKRLKDLHKSMALLEKAALNLWTIRDTQNALKAIFHPDALPSYNDSHGITDANGRPYAARPVYQWRGPASVSIDDKGIVRLRCDSIPEIDPDKRYIVSFEEY